MHLFMHCKLLIFSKLQSVCNLDLIVFILFRQKTKNIYKIYGNIFVSLQCKKIGEAENL